MNQLALSPASLTIPNACLLALDFPHFRHTWFFVIFLFCAAIVLSNVIHYALFRLLRRKEEESKSLGWGLQRYLGKPARAIFFLTCLLLILPAVPSLPDKVEDTIRQGLIMAMVASIGWFAVGCIYVLQSIMLRRYDLNAENNIQARRVHTQFQLFRRMLISFVVIIDIGALLWTFNDPRIWHYGSGLLASAGIASLIIATAAKSTAANFFAGLQIAVTEPLRIDDVVVVQGEWGRVEEINSAYVVIRIWDLRRLIVPLSYFIENSFQNWTRESSDILGTAFLYVDYSIPVEALRQQLESIVHPSPLWNKQVCGLQVTNLTDRSMELRCLMSSRNSSENFDLRCLVREKMTAWIQQNYPAAFPTTRFASRPDSSAQPQEGQRLANPLQQTDHH
ncbi:mechanosensitive ion channel family protein [Tunturibacter empetritectus]|uniref:Small-conductance mechanosensitive channel n=1 Tax=Tunturiibacter lichenicola TaxID=2051959 RepID=A0A7W8N4Q4_9BACT|nr:mechanosensitive ion channel domain-containing protein [Edaphobacter lichenicola]MBB5344778.1 small-conductance mechanosensitive channel [Edaphobacter lichenicola]